MVGNLMAGEKFNNEFGLIMRNKPSQSLSLKYTYKPNGKSKLAKAKLIANLYLKTTYKIITAI